jgi:uncharacterized protein (TIGR03089 family)
MARILPSARAPSPTTVARVRTARTFPELLDGRLHTDPAQPLVTAYDDLTGERAELSVTTYVNWVSKTANLLTDELGCDPGDTVLLDLPAHWLVPVFLGAAWTAGLAVTRERQVEHRVAVCGPESFGDHRDAEEVLACSLRPFAVRFPEPLPAGVLDYGVLWPAQSDVFVAPAPVSPDTVAWRSGDEAWSQADLLERAGLDSTALGERLLTDLNPATAEGVPAFLGPVLGQGSLVLLLHPREDTWAARRADERCTAERRSAQPPSL